MTANRQTTRVAIIGAGPAGLGCAALLKQMGIADDDMMVLEANSVGSSFQAWPKEMRLITPSFPSNGYHQTDLNAITPDTSPAFITGKEHLSGEEYAEYLRGIVRHYEISVTEQTRVTDVFPIEDGVFLLSINDDEVIEADYVIWAGGEYAAPRMDGFEGSRLCLHNSQVNTWEQCEDEQYVVIGCYESGVDAAYNLAKLGKKVVLLDANDEQEDTYDPSRVLSPHTSERVQEMVNSDLVDLVQGFEVKEVVPFEAGYQVTSTKGKTVFSQGTPINCTGFDANLGPVDTLFEMNDEGVPQVNGFDESTRQSNLFLTGSRLVHGSTILCFIYKFRGRFAAPCSVIGSELGLNLSVLSHYQQAGMLLDDLSCCEDQECYC